MSVGDKIRNRRNQLGLTQTELALLVETSQSKIWEYESGKTKPSIDTLKAIAHALEVSTDWILGVSDSFRADLDPNEIELLELYRSKSPDKQATAVRLLEAL